MQGVVSGMGGVALVYVSVCVCEWVGWCVGESVCVCVMVVVGVVGSVGNARAKFTRFGSMSCDVSSSKD